MDLQVEKQPDYDLEQDYAVQYVSLMKSRDVDLVSLWRGYVRRSSFKAPKTAHHRHRAGLCETITQQQGTQVAASHRQDRNVKR